MRFFYFFIFAILSGSILFAQDSANAIRPVSIRLRCQATLIDSNLPLFIVDGKQFSSEAISKIDPATIQRIDVLKDSKTTALYGSRGANGVERIILKKQDKYAFHVLDEEDSTGIDQALVTFVNKNNDSIKFIAGHGGEIKADLLSDDDEYSVSVTAFGYKNLKLAYKVYKGKLPKQLFMKRDVKELAEVIVRGLGYTCILRRLQSSRPVTQYCGFNTIRDSLMLSRVTPVITGPKIFPNPVIRGGVVKIELIADDTSPKQIRIVDVNGARVSSLTYVPAIGLNRIDIPVASHWAAGMYTVQVIDQKGKLLSQHKLLVQ